MLSHWIEIQQKSLSSRRGFFVVRARFYLEVVLKKVSKQALTKVGKMDSTVVWGFLVVLSFFMVYRWNKKVNIAIVQLLETQRVVHDDPKPPTVAENPEGSTQNIRISRKSMDYFQRGLAKTLLPLMEQFENSMVEQFQQLVIALEESQTSRVGLDDEEDEEDFETEPLEGFSGRYREATPQRYSSYMTRGAFEALASCSSIPPTQPDPKPQTHSPAPRIQAIPIDYTDAGNVLDDLTTDIQPGAADPDAGKESEFESVEFDMREFENPNHSNPFQAAPAN